MSAVRPPTDAEVVARSIDAPEAFLLIYDRYIGDLHGHLAARGAKADDQAQAVFRRAFTSRHKYDGQQPVRDWLYQLAKTTKQPTKEQPAPPSRETVQLGRNRLRDLIDAPPRRTSWLGSAAITAAGAAALVGVIVLANHQASPTTAPRDLPDLTVPANVQCVTTHPCTGPLPAVVSRPLIPCGEVRLCETPTPLQVRPPRSPSGRIPS